MDRRYPKTIEDAFARSPNDDMYLRVSADPCHISLRNVHARLVSCAARFTSPFSEAAGDVVVAIDKVRAWVVHMAGRTTDVEHYLAVGFAERRVDMTEAVLTNCHATVFGSREMMNPSVNYRVILGIRFQLYREGTEDAELIIEMKNITPGMYAASREDLGPNGCLVGFGARGISDDPPAAEWAAKEERNGGTDE